LNIANLLLKKEKNYFEQQMYGDLKNLAQLFYDYYKQHHLKSRLHPLSVMKINFILTGNYDPYAGLQDILKPISFKQKRI